MDSFNLIAREKFENYFPEYVKPLCDWEYLPPVGPSPSSGFVGLKNAGATCYMNAVIQQLCMIPTIRDGVLNVDNSKYGLRAINKEKEAEAKAKKNELEIDEVIIIAKHYSSLYNY